MNRRTQPTYASSVRQLMWRRRSTDCIRSRSLDGWGVEESIRENLDSLNFRIRTQAFVLQHLLKTGNRVLSGMAFPQTDSPNSKLGRAMTFLLA